SAALGEERVRRVQKESAFVAERFAALFRREAEEAPDWLAEDAAPWPQGIEPERRRAFAAGLAEIRELLEQGGFPPRAPSKLRRFLAEAMPAWIEDANGVQALARWVALLRRMRGRWGYLDLAADHEGVRRWLIGVLSAGRFVADRVAQDPALLEWPIEQQGLGEELGAWIARLDAIAADDEEAALRALARATEQAKLAVALAADAHLVDGVQAGAAMADLADAAARAARRVALGALGLDEEFPLVVVAMGKWGSREMSPASDLDLVFVLADDAPRRMLASGRTAMEMAQRAARRTLQTLTQAPPFGAGFAVDARLRPAGQAGVLCVSIQGLADYYRKEAMLWEHQALARARAVAGPDGARARVEALIQKILNIPRDPEEVARAMREMKAKIERHHGGKPGVIDLKHDPGGMVDIEFAAQYARLVLHHGETGVVSTLAAPPI
ncbi:MAG: bifunctional [glutamate--ammonia ligase]-adenylyl-L-tyrosine phosphorylase/[glutamate--ammonia-ligase] adenylyltransferase, partial [Zetaproteobacteria bacterium]